MTEQFVAQKIPLRLLKRQCNLIEKCFAARRFVWNQCVATFNSYDKKNNPNPTYLSGSQIYAQNEYLKDNPIPHTALNYVTFREFSNCGKKIFEM